VAINVRDSVREYGNIQVDKGTDEGAAAGVETAEQYVFAA